MLTNWKNLGTGERAKLHKLTSGEVFAVMTDDLGNGTRQLTFASTTPAKEFFNNTDGWVSA